MVKLAAVFAAGAVVGVVYHAKLQPYVVQLISFVKRYFSRGA
jgi:hypothetical protein